MSSSSSTQDLVKVMDKDMGGSMTVSIAALVIGIFAIFISIFAYSAGNTAATSSSNASSNTNGGGDVGGGAHAPPVSIANVADTDIVSMQIQADDVVVTLGTEIPPTLIPHVDVFDLGDRHNGSGGVVIDKSGMWQINATWQVTGRINIGLYKNLDDVILQRDTGQASANNIVAITRILYLEADDIVYAAYSAAAAAPATINIIGSSGSIPGRYGFDLKYLGPMDPP